VNDFDFLVCSWQIANRRLTKALAGSDEWEELPSMFVGHRFSTDGGASLETNWIMEFTRTA
jgi:hypothetical protein